jgi:hypothetical protein
MSDFLKKDKVQKFYFMKHSKSVITSLISTKELYEEHINLGSDWF